LGKEKQPDRRIRLLHGRKHLGAYRELKLRLNERRVVAQCDQVTEIESVSRRSRNPLLLLDPGGAGFNEYINVRVSLRLLIAFSRRNQRVTIDPWPSRRWELFVHHTYGANTHPNGRHDRRTAIIGSSDSHDQGPSINKLREQNARSNGPLPQMLA